METVELKYQLENDDFVAFNLQFSKSSATHAHAIRRSRLIVSAVSAAVLFGIFYWWFRSWVAASSIAAVGALLAWMILPREYWKQMKKTIWRMADCEGIGEPGRYRLMMEESGLREETDGKITAAAYSSISKIDETDEHVFVYSSPISAYIIPKREVGTRLAGFLEELRRRCGTEAAGTDRADTESRSL